MLGSSVWAGDLSDRLQEFPHWQSPPKGTVAKGELIYPDWFEGSWRATSILREAIAPLAPEIITPGFEQNQDSIGEPVIFTVRFTDDIMPVPIKGMKGITELNRNRQPKGIVADRVFNSKSLGNAALGAGFVESVQLDPNNFSRLTTEFNNGQQLISESRERATETYDREFISSEMFQQTFRSHSQLYLNQVENTTDYRLTQDHPKKIEANQITAIYLSPKDPDFFKARNRPVALYQYDLVLEK
ncbi:MAG: hypothetical protein HC810_07855 [Acaryochloridaceae cyanobacterium RL_2_7]|nr:hypothetical protein [Acaryochloridaceae cyanobacterium RL_2_7]